MSTPEFAFDRDTAVTELAAASTVTPALFAAQISDQWGTPGGNANGGYALSVCLQALRRTLKHPDPLAVSMFFERPVVPGPVEVEVTPARTGRRMSFGQARLLRDGAEIGRMTASFADLSVAEGASACLTALPDLPPVEDCFDLFERHADARTGVLQWVDARYPQRPGWHAGKPTGAGQTEFWMRFADGRQADSLSLPGLVDMAAPAVLELGHYLTTTIELTAYVRAIPAPGWLRCRTSTMQLIDGYHEEDFEIWDSTGALVAQSRQLAMLLS